MNFHISCTGLVGGKSNGNKSIFHIFTARAVAASTSSIIHSRYVVHNKRGDRRHKRVRNSLSLFDRFPQPLCQLKSTLRGGECIKQESPMTEFRIYSPNYTSGLSRRL